MNEEELREMYGEYCMESSERMSEKGYEDFKAWRKRVEDLFDKRADSS